MKHVVFRVRRRAPRRALFWMIWAAVLSTALAACSAQVSGSKAINSSGGDQSAGYGGTLQIASLLSDMDAIDPAQEWSIQSWQIGRAITRQLVTFEDSPNGLGSATKLVPDLAESWTISPDGLTYTFHLRPDIYYSGSTHQAIVAKDFVYAVERFCDVNKQVADPTYYNATLLGFQQYCAEESKDVKPGTEAAVTAWINAHPIPSVTAPNPTTVVFHLRQKSTDFLSILTMNFVTPMPENIVGSYIPDSLALRQHFPSSGPYYISSYAPGKELTLTKVPHYDSAGDPARPSYVNKIVVNFTTNTASAVVQAIESGSADLALYLGTPPVSTIATYEAEHSPYIHSSIGGGQDFINVNDTPYNNSVGGKALRNLKVRQALAYAINYQHIVQLFGGSVVAQPNHQVLIPTQVGYVKYDPYPTPNNEGDPAKAKELLKEAGYPNGITFNAIYETVDENGSNGAELATALKSDLAKSGITLNLIQLPASSFAAYLENPKSVWDLNLTGVDDPDFQGDDSRQMLGGQLDSQVADGCGATNYGICFNSPVFNKYVTEAEEAANQAPYWEEADHYASAQLVYIPLITINAVAITSSRVRHFEWANLPVAPDITAVSVVNGK